MIIFGVFGRVPIPHAPTLRASASFLTDGLLGRLIHLAYGLSVVLCSIGIKPLTHVQHKNDLPFLNVGEANTAIPEIPTWLSLLVVVMTLVVTTVLGLRAGKKVLHTDMHMHEPGRTAIADAGAGGPDDAPVRPGDAPVDTDRRSRAQE